MTFRTRIFGSFYLNKRSPLDIILPKMIGRYVNNVGSGCKQKIMNKLNEKVTAETHERLNCDKLVHKIRIRW